MKHSELLAHGLRDLAARRSLGTTGTAVFTIAVLAAIAVVCYGLAIGRREAERAKIQANTHLRCLRVGNNLTTRAQFTGKLIYDLRKQLDDRRLYAGVVEALQPYRSCADSLSGWSLQQDGRYAPLRGRTVAIEESKEELFLRGRKVRGGGRLLAKADDEGVLLTPSALKKLGVEGPGENIDSIWVSAGPQTQKIAVFGILEENLPNFYDYVIPERFEARLVHPQSEEEFPSYVSGPAPKPWQEQFRVLKDGSIDLKRPEVTNVLPEAALFDRATLIVGDRIQIRAREPVDETQHPRMTAAWWRDLLRRLGQKLGKQTGVEQPDFWSKSSYDGRVAEHGEYHREADDFINIYVYNIDSLGPVANVCEALPELGGEGTVDREVIKRLDAVDDNLHSALKTISTCQVALVFLGFVTLAAIQFMRSAEKTSEAGMLRAMGMPRRQLIALVCWQAVVVCLLGATVGISVGAIAGYMLAAAQTAANEPVGFSVSRWLPPVIVGAAISLSCSSALLATATWYWREPLSLLRRQ